MPLLRRPPPARSPPSDVRCLSLSGTGADLQFLIRAKAYLYYFMTADEHAAPEAGAPRRSASTFGYGTGLAAPGGAVALVRAEVAYSGDSTVFGADGTVSDTEDSLAPGASSWLGLASHQRIGTGEGGLADAFALRVRTMGSSGWVEGATVGVALIVEVLDNGARPRGDSGPLRQKAYYSTRSTPYGTPDTFTPFIEQVIAVAGLCSAVAAARAEAAAAAAPPVGYAVLASSAARRAAEGARECAAGSAAATRVAAAAPRLPPPSPPPSPPKPPPLPPSPAPPPAKMAEVIELSIDFDGTEGSDGSTLRQIFEDNLRTEVAEALSIPKDAVIIHAVDVANGEIQLGFLAGDAAERVGAGDQTTVSTTLEVAGGPCADFDEAAMEVALAAELGVDAARVSVTKDCSGADASPIIVDDDRRRRLSESTDTASLPFPVHVEVSGLPTEAAADAAAATLESLEGEALAPAVGGTDEVPFTVGAITDPPTARTLTAPESTQEVFDELADMLEDPSSPIFSGAVGSQLKGDIVLVVVTPPAPPPTPPPPEEIRGYLSGIGGGITLAYNTIVEAIGVGGFAGVCAGAFVCLCVIPCVICCVCRRRRRKRKQSEEDLWENIGRPAGVRHLGHVDMTETGTISVGFDDSMQGSQTARDVTASAECASRYPNSCGWDPRDDDDRPQRPPRMMRRPSSLVDHVMHDHAYRAPPPGLPPTTDGFDDPYATNYDEYGNNLGASVQDPNWCGRRRRGGRKWAMWHPTDGRFGRRRRGRPADGRGAHREVGDGIRPMRGPSAGRSSCASAQRRSRLAASHPSSRAAEEEGEEGPVRQEKKEKEPKPRNDSIVAFDVARCTGSGAPAHHSHQPLCSPSLFTPETKPLNHQQAAPRPPRPHTPPLTRARPAPRRVCFRRLRAAATDAAGGRRRVGVGGARDRLRPGLLFQYADE